MDIKGELNDSGRFRILYVNNPPALVFFDTDELKALGGVEEEFAIKLETVEDGIEADYGVYGYQANMPDIGRDRFPLMVDKTLWTR